ncbi:hypothetical protein BLX24_21625 [Arsenicibacter rosenii]|uniref:Uncharacterized protein n=1 Tax=Arsenicibacter rosenii TaxID=1750698 RepID=A0A1S2VEL7_9BACT|nr:hypothetical protein BLX24_21625 [Arsenicibacter rosenii]
MAFSRKALECIELASQIEADFDQQAHQVIHRFMDLHELNGRYEITEFTRQCVSAFLMEWYVNAAIERLPEGTWVTVIEMYMGLSEMDYEYLDTVHHRMNQRD